MVRKFVAAYLCAATAFVCSCNKEENLSTPPLSLEHSITLSAGAAGSDETRATFDKDGHFYWLPEDAVGVANSSGTFSKLTLKDGSYSKSGTFTGEVKGSIEGAYAVYPYNENHKIDGNTLTYHLPDTYTYKDLDHDYFTEGTKSYNNSANSPAYGVISVDDKGNARTTFQHLCGVLCIRVIGLKSKSGYITLTADRKITGDFTVDLNGSEPKISTSNKSETSSTERTVTINYESTTYDGTSGVDGVFYIPMPAGNYYLTLEVGYTDGFGKTARVTKTKTNSIARKDMMRMKVNYSTMATGSYVIYHGHKFVNLGLPSGTFWAETNVGAETSTDYGGYYLWEDAVALTTWKKTWGNKCRLPSAAEAMELKENCTLEPYNITYDWDLRSYKGSLKVTGKNGNSIILPAAWYKDSAGNLKEPYMDPSLEGLYWTSDSNTYLLIYITTNTGTKLDSFMTQTDNAGYYCTIRPVITPAK